MENCCRKVLFCDVEPVWRTDAGRYFFVMRSQCGELLQEGIVLSCRASVKNCCLKVLFWDAEPVWRTVARRYCFVMLSQCGELLQDGIVL